MRGAGGAAMSQAYGPLAGLSFFPSRADKSRQLAHTSATLKSASCVLFICPWLASVSIGTYTYSSPENGGLSRAGSCPRIKPAELTTALESFPAPQQSTNPMSVSPPEADIKLELVQRSANDPKPTCYFSPIFSLPSKFENNNG